MAGWHFPTPHQTTKLLLDAERSRLFVSTHNRVRVWNLDHQTFEYECPGLLVGLARDRDTFLTYNSQSRREPKGAAWQVTTGTSVALPGIAPHHYALHQRAILIKTEWNRLLILDLLDRDTSSLVTEHDWLASGAIAPNDTSVILTFGDEKVYGRCVELRSHTTVYTFTTHHWGQPPIYLAAEQELLICAGQVYTLSAGTPVATLPGTGSIFRVSSGDHWLVAVSTVRGKHIHLVDIQVPSAQKVIRTLTESGPSISDIVFHPDGRHLACLLSDGQVHLWNTETGALAWQLDSRSH